MEYDCQSQHSHIGVVSSWHRSGPYQSCHSLQPGLFCKRIAPGPQDQQNYAGRHFPGIARLQDRNFCRCAQRVGKSQSAVANKLRLLRHSPQVLALLRENQLSERHARALLRLPEEEDRLAVLQTVIRQQLNVAKTEAYIDAYLAKKNAQEPPKRGIRKLIVRDVRLFLNSVNHSLELVRSAGIQAETKQEETDREIVLTIRLPKRAG